jgi:hypothetical protein
MNSVPGSQNAVLLSKDSWGRLQKGIARLRGEQTAGPEATIIVPVNAQNDLGNFYNLLEDLGRYTGNHRYEVIAIVNNYPLENPPKDVEHLQSLGIRVISIPDARKPGETVSFSARVPGIMAASTEKTIHFDADCRIPNITAILDYYIEQLNEGCQLAYTRVDFFDLPELLVIRIRVAIHHGARSLKRNILKIPTPRGSNYAVSKAVFLQLYETGGLRDDIQLGPNIKEIGGKHRYCNSKEMTVLTSGRKIRKSWPRIFRYIFRRLLFNIRYIRDTEAARSLKM